MRCNVQPPFPHGPCSVICIGNMRIVLCSEYAYCAHVGGNHKGATSSSHLARTTQSARATITSVMRTATFWCMVCITIFNGVIGAVVDRLQPLHAALPTSGTASAGSRIWNEHNPAAFRPGLISGLRLRGGGGLRIALCAWESLHSIPVGGVAPHVTEVAAGLARRGNEVHLYTRAGHEGGGHQVVHDVHVHHVPIELDSDFVNECNNMCNAFIWFIRETEAFMGQQFDIVHAHDWLAGKTIVQAKNIGRRTVFTCHSTEFGRCGNVHFEGQSARVRGIENESCDHADMVIAVSGRLCDEVKELYGCGHKLRMAYNGIHLHNFDGMVNPGEIKQRYGIGPLQPTVLFVGRLVVQKGPDILLESVPAILPQHPDAVIVFCGDGHMRGELEGRAHQLGVQHAVRFLGTMSGEPLKELFKATDAVCVPSRNEPFGIVVLEAWACAKPVVVTQSGGPGEFVRHEQDGYHVYAEPGSVAWGLNKVFEDFNRAREMGDRGRARCEHEFSWDNIADQTERIYRELTG